MDYLFVDFENIAPRSVSHLPSNQSVLVFVGEKQARMDTDFVQSLMDREIKPRLIRIDGDGKNAVDFHIAFYLGRLSEADRGASFRILSKDKGFDPLVRHLKKSGIDCDRIEKLPAGFPAKADLQTKLNAFVAHLNGLDEKARPKKVSKLKAYLKNWAQKDALLVEPLFSRLQSGRNIEIDGEKIRYIISGQITEE